MDMNGNYISAILISESNEALFMEQGVLHAMHTGALN